MNSEKKLKEQCINIMVEHLPVLRKNNTPDNIVAIRKGLGEVIGVSRQTITNIESGRSEMKWLIFLTLMFVFSLDNESNEYLKRLDFPYEDVKNWLKSKKM